MLESSHCIELADQHQLKCISGRIHNFQNLSIHPQNWVFTMLKDTFLTFSKIGKDTLQQLPCDLLFPCSSTAVPLTQRVLNRIWNLTELFQVAFSTCNYHVSCTSKSKWFGCKHPIRLDRRQGAALVVITNNQQSRERWGKIKNPPPPFFFIFNLHFRLF